MTFALGLLVVLGRLVGSVTGGGVVWWGVDWAVGAGPGVFGDVFPALVGVGCCAGVVPFCAWAPNAAGAGVAASEPLCGTGFTVSTALGAGPVSC